MHFIGIGGIGMSGLARLLLDRKQAVSGSDLKRSAMLRTLEADGARVTDQCGEALTKETRVVVSTAVQSDNAEYKKAVQLGCPILHRSDLLVELMHGYKTLAVTGTHGKTTISSLLAWVLYDAGLDPAFALGGILKDVQRNGRHGDGDYFVAEADESDGSFVKYCPHAAIVSNIEAEHLDHFGSEEAMIEGFRTFIGNVQDHLFWCGDDPILQTLKPSGTAYGFSPGLPLRAENLSQSGFSITFDVYYEGKPHPQIEVALIGKHNALNALAVFGLCLHLGLSEKAIRKALASFPGIGRRMDRREGPRGTLLIDDYAHHPTEVEATLRSLREAVGNRRVIAIFQPHRYTRFQLHMDAFSKAFDAADQVWVTDVYTAGEDPIPGVTVERFLQMVEGKHFNRFRLFKEMQEGDVVITLGAGVIPSLKLKTGIVYGGSSPEHDVSVKSAKFLLDHLDPDLYDPVEITDGQIPDGLDVVFPMIHGPGGEDGLISAACEQQRIPCVGCDFRSASLAMHKALTKRVAASYNIPTLPWVEVRRGENIPDVSLLQFPVFVKPVHLGSSIGISKVETLEELPAAVEAALELDEEVIIEQGVVAREIHFACLDDEIPPPGEVFFQGRFNDFDAKYGTPDGNVNPKADLPPDLIEKGREFARRVYRALRCRSMARIDLFLDEENRYWLNEVNPLPGFSANSPYPMIWQANGVSPDELMYKLIVSAQASAQ